MRKLMQESVGKALYRYNLSSLGGGVVDDDGISCWIS